MVPTFCGKTHEDLFWRSYQKKVFMIFVGENCTKMFLGKFEKIWAQILRIPQNLPAPAPM